MGKKQKKRDVIIPVRKPGLFDRIIAFFIDKAVDSYFNGVWIKKIKGKKKIVVIYY